MSHSGRGRHRHVAETYTVGDGSVESKGFFGVICLLLFVATFFVAGPWAGFHAVLLGCYGILILLFPPKIKLPAVWLGLAIAFLLAGSAAFLPVSWFHVPEWRSQLESLGVNTGPLVVIQSRMAMESLALFAITIFAGFWMAGQRPTPSQIRLWALVFTMGVACYAVISKLNQISPLDPSTIGSPIYGFFPNRNHSATYLAMGVVCGLGCTLQAMRDKRFVILAIALAGTSVCLWAIAAWSISRAGIVLVSIGGLLWVVMLGRRYLGRHGIWVIALITLIAGGLFLITNTEVKERITDTVSKVNTIIGPESIEEPMVEKSSTSSIEQVDFRVSVYLDTFDLIREYPWTGIGAGQYQFIIPQYRNRTIIWNDFILYHSDSDWLWMASEVGIPATLFLLALVVFAVRKSLKDILTGRDRALRAGCLVAAMLVPIHGIFDVPGHRITLALTAVFLFVLSLHPPGSVDSAPVTHRLWSSRVLGLCLLVISFFLIRAEWGGGGRPALSKTESVSRQAISICEEELAVKKVVGSESQDQEPTLANENIEQALRLIRSGIDLAPLDCGLHRLESALALKVHDKYSLAERASAIELALDPAWVVIPLRQADAWIEINPEKTKDLWQEAVRRSDRIDALNPGETSARDQTLKRIQQQAAGRPELENWSPAG